jgi:hypothetical protein
MESTSGCRRSQIIGKPATMYDDSKEFAKVFTSLLRKSGVTCYQIHNYTDLDQGYLIRLLSGEKHEPSRETLFKISLALAACGKGISLYDIRELFNSAGRTLFSNSG